MANRTTNIVLDLFTVMNTLSGVQGGMTVGEMQKCMTYVTRGQVQRVMKMLEDMSFAYQEIKPHGRTGKKVYHLTETAAIHCAAIARQYTEAGR